MVRNTTGEVNMCGVSGFIGKSKDPRATFQLATKLFEKSEIRGTDASGFWGCTAGDDGVVLYHKEPRKATQFVHSDVWKNLKNMNPNLLLMHVRASSVGIGDAKYNKNNHPFTNTDKSVGLIHNGRIWEYALLKKRYNVRSDCDSEILLRIFEAARASVPDDPLEGIDIPEDITSSLLGIRQIFSHVNDSHMAVAIGERHEGSRRDLWLFHNSKRPLWAVDAREHLGQIFFVSTPEIWAAALRECPQALSILGGRKHTIRELPTEEAWYFSVDDDHPTVEGQGHGHYRFVLDGKNEFTPWDEKGPIFPILPPSKKLTVVSGLGDNDEPLTGTTWNTPNNRHNHKKNKKHHQQHRTGNDAWHEHIDEEYHYAPQLTWDGNQARYTDQNSHDDYVIDSDDYHDHDDTLRDDEDGELIELAPVESPYQGMTSYKIDKNNQLVSIERHAVGYSNDNSENSNSAFDLVGLEAVVRQIKQLVSDIETTATNLAGEGSITPQDFQNNLDALRMIYDDLKGTQHLLDAV
jgi:hypothetical protein